jgi:hypothetical protein
MEVSTYVPDTALPQSQQGSSDLTQSPGSSQLNVKARYIIRGDALQVYRLMCVSRHLRKGQYDTFVPDATKIMPSGKASGYISERFTIPIPNSVSFAGSVMLAPTSTGATSGKRILVLTPTLY